MREKIKQSENANIDDGAIGAANAAAAKAKFDFEALTLAAIEEANREEDER